MAVRMRSVYTCGGQPVHMFYSIILTYAFGKHRTVYTVCERTMHIRAFADKNVRLKIECILFRILRYISLAVHVLQNGRLLTVNTT